MSGPFGPFGLPWSEILQIPDGGRATIADLSGEPHYSETYGRHYDASLVERHGGRLDVIDKMHIDPSGNILDP